MKKKIAIPTDATGILDAHFGHCKFFVLITFRDDEIVLEEKVVPPPHEPGVLPKWLADKQVTDILARGMGRKAMQLFKQYGINVTVGAPREAARELAKGYLKNTLTLSANHCDH
ncbi:MAG: hypothetical protein MI975_16130 [Cytophagales bacterium]|nr:hypothetical protein [Cytophagales bacterium]